MSSRAFYYILYFTACSNHNILYLRRRPEICATCTTHHLVVLTAVYHYILCPCELPRDSRETTRFAAGYAVTPPSYAQRERAHFSRAVAVLPATLAHSTTQAGDPGFLCILHKNKCQKLRNFVQNFIKMWFFGFRPQYVVDFDPFYPTKSPTSCGFTQFAFRSKWCYTVLAQSKTAPQHQPAVRRVYPPRRKARGVPCQLHSANAKLAQHISQAFHREPRPNAAQVTGYWRTLKIEHRDPVIPPPSPGLRRGVKGCTATGGHTVWSSQARKLWVNEWILVA